MDPQTKTTGAQPVSRPVMDVKPRQSTSPAPITAPVEPPAEEPNADAPAEKPEAQKKPEPPKSAKPHTPNVGLAIVATVIIVLGLGLLATYAYLKQTS